MLKFPEPVPTAKDLPLAVVSLGGVVVVSFGGVVVVSLGGLVVVSSPIKMGDDLVQEEQNCTIRAVQMMMPKHFNELYKNWGMLNFLYKLGMHFTPGRKYICFD